MQIIVGQFSPERSTCYLKSGLEEEILTITGPKWVLIVLKFKAQCKFLYIRGRSHSPSTLYLTHLRFLLLPSLPNFDDMEDHCITWWTNLRCANSIGLRWKLNKSRWWIVSSSVSNLDVWWKSQTFCLVKQKLWYDEETINMGKNLFDKLRVGRYKWI